MERTQRARPVKATRICVFDVVKVCSSLPVLLQPLALARWRWRYRPVVHTLNPSQLAVLFFPRAHFRLNMEECCATLCPLLHALELFLATAAVAAADALVPDALTGA